MNYVKLAFIYLVHKPFFTFFTALFLIIPVAIVTSVLLFSHEAEIFFLNNISGVDLILSAKGSNSEIVKKCLFYYGPELIPVSLMKTRNILHNSNVAYAVPLLISGNYRGYSVVGTNNNIRKIYNASLRDGIWWQQDFEAVIGNNVAAKTGLKPGDTIYYLSGTRNFTDSLSDHGFRITGILGKMNSSMDNAILTSIDNLWILHDSLKSRSVINKRVEPKKPADYFPFDFPARNNANLTAVLISLRSPVLPSAFIKQDSLRKEFQVINPAVELPVEFQSLQFTLSALVWSGISVFFVGLLALFVRLHYLTRERSGDLLLLRTMGASSRKIMFVIILQGLLIADVAAFTGILFAHAILGIMSTFPVVENLFGVSGTLVLWKEILIYFTVIISATLVSLFPALKARNNDILLDERIIF